MRHMEEIMNIRQFRDSDLAQMIAIWNEVVEEGIAFPQEELLTIETGRDFFGFQTYTAVADEEYTGFIFFIRTM